MLPSITFPGIRLRNTHAGSIFNTQGIIGSARKQNGSMLPELREKDDLVAGQKPNASTNTLGTATIFPNQVLNLFSASNQTLGDSLICREIFDMQGNLWEWVQDYYAPLVLETVTQPSGPKEGRL